ncbi:MAG: hypothetical protein ACR2FN_01050 [Chitinophagaceae bacterium]
MKFNYPSLKFIIFCSLFVYAQKSISQTDDSKFIPVFDRTEVSLTVAANNFLGDLGGNLGAGGPFLKDFTWKTVKPLVGLSAGYYAKEWLQVKAGFNFTSVAGADSLIKPTTDLARWRIYRNLSFKSSIFEAYITGDVYPLTFFNKEHTTSRWSPYLSFGVGIFHFNPKAELNGQWIALQPLRLEGEGFAEYPDRKPYNLTQIYLPATIAVKYYFNDNYSLSGGATFRKTFTDYIDDISTTYIDPALFDKYLTPDQAALAKQLYERSLQPEKVKPGVVKANASNKDTYMTIFLTFSVMLNQSSREPRFKYGIR